MEFKTQEAPELGPKQKRIREQVKIIDEELSNIVDSLDDAHENDSPEELSIAFKKLLVILNKPEILKIQELFYDLIIDRAGREKSKDGDILDKVSKEQSAALIEKAQKEVTEFKSIYNDINEIQNCINSVDIAKAANPSSVLENVDQYFEQELVYDWTDKIAKGCTFLRILKKFNDSELSFEEVLFKLEEELEEESMSGDFEQKNYTQKIEVDFIKHLSEVKKHFLGDDGIKSFSFELHTPKDNVYNEDEPNFVEGFLIFTTKDDEKIFINASGIYDTNLDNLSRIRFSWKKGANAYESDIEDLELE